MSILTGAAQGLNEFLAERELERQRALVEAIAQQDRAYQRSRDTRADARETERDARERQREARIDADAQARIDEVARQNRYRNALTLRTTAQPGALTREAFEGMREFNLDQGVATKTPGIALALARPSVQASPDDIPTLPSTLNVGTSDQFESLGGTEFQEATRNEAARKALATQAQTAAAEAKEEQRKFDERMQRANNETKAMVAGIAAANRGQMTPNQEFNNSMKLSAQWDRATAGVREVQRQLGMMQVGWQAVTGAGDAEARNAGGQAIVNTFNKILDPLSVVRESEYLRSVMGQSLLDRVQAGLEQAVKGGAGLTNNELKKLVDTAEQFAQRYEASMAGFKARTQATAKKYKLDDPTGSMDTPTPTDAPPATAPAKPAAPNLRQKWGY